MKRKMNRRTSLTLLSHLSIFLLVSTIFLFVPMTLPAQETIYFPHAANVGSWETEICVINTSSEQSLSGTLKAYNNSGQLLDSISVSLPSNARREIAVGNEFSNPASIGYIVFKSDSKSVCGYLKFYVNGQYRVAIPAASGVNTGDIYVSHIASDDNWRPELKTS